MGVPARPGRSSHTAFPPDSTAMNVEYPYIGSKDLARDAIGKTARVRVTSEADVIAWVNSSRQKLDGDRSFVATFVIRTTGELWIADRHSEHVACADGRPVLSAGEMTFQIDRDTVTVVAASNQSLGYCPEPDSWPAVAAALDVARIPHMGDLTSPYIIRRCPSCDMRNIVKDDVYECSTCGSELPRERE